MRSIELKAPTGKYRVVCVDTFDHTDWVEGDFGTKEDAIYNAKRRSDMMLKAYIYNDQGSCVGDYGTF